MKKHKPLCSVALCPVPFLSPSASVYSEEDGGAVSPIASDEKETEILLQGYTFHLKCSYSPPPQMFFVKTNPLVIEAFRRKIWNLVESSIFHALSQSHLKCCSTAF